MTSGNLPQGSAGEVVWSPLEGGGAVARVRGFFDDSCTRALERHASSLSEGSPLVLNLSAVSYLSSSGIGEIVHLASRFPLALASPSEAVVHLLTLAEVWPVLDVGGSEEEALTLTRQKC